MSSSSSSPSSSSSNTPPTWDLASSIGSAATVHAVTNQPIEHPTQIGPYRILSVLGEGGMGLVYIAEQREPVHRRVAIKVIKLGMDTRDVVARFQAERQALALMDHPNIARVYEAGATDAGRPYFAMELVSGVPITRFCDEQTLSTQQRLELFAIVCDAVQHAHAKGIIHRDIKPGNVLVTFVDGKPVPKIIDFGIAKATNQRLTERTVFTELGRMVGTPEYMSPEQAESAPRDVDTRTDVYSLGVVLYELLTGTLPYEPKELRSKGWDSIHRMIREIDPPRPSTRFGKLNPDDAQTRAEKRRETTDSLSSMLRRELEWIPLKAMRKDREHRYRTASELADDVRNYLQGRPLIAGPETKTYRARKFLRRNRMTVIAASIMLLLLVGGIVGTSYQAVRATRAERQAQQRFDDTRTIARDLIFQLHPQIERLAGSSGAMKQLTETSLPYLERLAVQSPNDPALREAISVGYQKLGDAQGNPNTANRGNIDAATKSYQLARDAAQQGLAIDPIDDLMRRKLTTALAAATMKLGDMLLERNKLPEALEHFTQAHATMRQAADADPAKFESRFNPLTTTGRLVQAHLALGDVKSARQVANDGVTIATALVKDFNNDKRARDILAAVWGHVSTCATRAGDFNGGIEALQRSLEIKRALATESPDDGLAQLRLARSYSALADAMDNAGRTDEAVAANAQATIFARRATTLDPLDLQYREHLGVVLLRGGDLARGKDQPDRAATLYHEAIEVYRKTLETAPKSSGTTQMLSVTYGQLAELERVRGRIPESLAAHQAGIDLLTPLVNASPSNQRLRGGLAYALRNFANALRDAKRLDDALTNSRRALEIELEINKLTPSDDRAARNRLYSQRILAEILIAVAAKPDQAAAARDAARQEARTLLTQTLTEYESKRAAGTLAQRDAETIEQTKAHLAELDRGATTSPTTMPS